MAIACSVRRSRSCERNTRVVAALTASITSVPLRRLARRVDAGEAAGPTVGRRRSAWSRARVGRMREPRATRRGRSAACLPRSARVDIDARHRRRDARQRAVDLPVAARPARCAASTPRVEREPGLVGARRLDAAEGGDRGVDHARALTAKTTAKKATQHRSARRGRSASSRRLHRAESSAHASASVTGRGNGRTPSARLAGRDRSRDAERDRRRRAAARRRSR